jgi:GGDEF domain-containing protein
MQQTKDGFPMSRTPRLKRNASLVRGRFRVVFFLFLVVIALVAGAWYAALPALAGAFVGLISLVAARSRGHYLTYTFVVIDWLLLGCALALAGGVFSWLIIGVPLLATVYLGISPRPEWPYLLAPALVLLIVVAIADPSLGGNRLVGGSIIILLLAGGVAAAHRLTQQRGRITRPVRVDGATGFYAGERLHELGNVRLAAAASEGLPVSLLYAQLASLDDGRHLPSVRGRGALAKEASRRLRARLGRADLAFRVTSDAFVLLLPGRTAEQARDLAARAADDISSGLIAGRRQALVFGVAAFPQFGSMDELLAVARTEAHDGLLALEPEQAALLATAQ